jgi:hypothetical protein
MRDRIETERLIHRLFAPGASRLLSYACAAVCS